MADEKPARAKVQKNKSNYDSGMSGAGYCLGIIGAAVYFVQQASGFGEVLVALLKALVWPAFAVYEVLKFIQA